MIKMFINFVCFIIFLLNVEINAQVPKMPDFQIDEKRIPPCQSCKILVKSFYSGMERTSRNKHDGGDSAWEESRLGSYANSEIRLIEIEEKLCSELSQGKIQCHHLLEENEALLEDWWKSDKSLDLYQYMCIDHLKVCCPENTFGPDCKPCSGDLTKPCSGRGYCRGAGTRKGTGECRCDKEYAGKICDQCKIGYFKEDLSEGNWKCVKCDSSCKGHCRKEGPMGCEICADGYQYTTEYGCMDIDECIESKVPVCKGNTFCANILASYRCLECDKSCEGCYGDGPDMCNKCAEGFVKTGDLCVEESPLFKNLNSDLTRYGTYFGLCLSTLIIFRKNIFVAALIGLSVAIYISLSEYTLGEWNKQDMVSYMKSWLAV